MSYMNPYRPTHSRCQSQNCGRPRFGPAPERPLWVFCFSSCAGLQPIFITQRFRIDCWACQARGAASVCLRSGVSSCPRRPIQPTHHLTGISLHTCHRQVKTDRCEKHAGRNTPRASNHQPATRGWACQEASYRVVYHNGQYSIQRGPWSAHGGIQVTNGDLVENKTHLT